MARALAGDRDAALQQQHHEADGGHGQHHDGLEAERLHRRQVTVFFMNPYVVNEAASARAIHGGRPYPTISTTTATAPSTTAASWSDLSLLLQHDDAERHRDQRRDEVAERRVDHVVVVHGPDVDPPVEREPERTERHSADERAVAPRRLPPCPLAAGRQPDGDDEQRPHHPVEEHLDRGGRSGVVEVEREQAPQPVGQDAGERPAATFRHSDQLSGGIVRAIRA